MINTKQFICSDIHLNHRAIVKYCPHRVDSSFTGDISTASDSDIDNLVQLMNERIVTNWNLLISPEDSVIILGDVAMGQIHLAPSLIRRLNGKKTLVTGNHDKTLVKLIKNNSEHSDLFVEICDYKEISVKVDNVKRFICMSHFPMKFWNCSSRPENPSIMLHGHTHSPPDKLHCRPGNILDVGIDGNNLSPRLLEDAVRLAVAHGEKNPIEHHH